AARGCSRRRRAGSPAARTAAWVRRSRTCRRRQAAETQSRPSPAGGGALLREGRAGAPVVRERRAGRDVTALPALPRIFSPELPPGGQRLRGARRELAPRVRRGAGVRAFGGRGADGGPESSLSRADAWAHAGS